MDTQFTSTDIKYLKMLSSTYPTAQSVCTEIVNLRAILNLPKGTEHFISDIHGEYEGFRHILRNASGSVRRKIDQTLGEFVSPAERRALAALIYYPEDKLHYLKRQGGLDREWYQITLKQLIAVANITTSKYTRSKVRKALPPEYGYIINELMTTGSREFNKEEYYRQIVESIIDVGSADSFIVALCHLITNTVIDKLHIVGDIFDRGSSPHLVMDLIEKQRYVDIQWGNHDILWMGAASGNLCCIANAVRICLRYNNYDFLEDGYGINMRPLSNFAMEAYADDPCTGFQPKHNKDTAYDEGNDAIIAKMHKAIAMIQFKLESQTVKAHPEYAMEDRCLLDAIDYEAGTLTCDGKVYPMLSNLFPTVDPRQPDVLTPEEQKVMEGLQFSFLNCERLQHHVEVLFHKGSLYKYYNNVLMFHGCIPMDENGSFAPFYVNGQPYAGKKLMDYCERMVRTGRYGAEDSPEKAAGSDFMWYLWCGPKSPLFGKHKMATFERYFCEDKDLHKEISDPYYKLGYTSEKVDQMLGDFGIADQSTVIVNGHVPVKIKKGESPIKVEGRLVIIDGGISKAYQSVTGIAGYTLVSNSHEIYLSEHDPFNSVADTVENNSDMHSRFIHVRTYPERATIADTDDGKEIKARIEDLEKLLMAYRRGLLN